MGGAGHAHIFYYVGDNDHYFLIFVDTESALSMYSFVTVYFLLDRHFMGRRAKYFTDAERRAAKLAADQTERYDAVLLMDAFVTTIFS
jgi:hypothetical protein